MIFSRIFVSGIFVLTQICQPIAATTYSNANISYTTSPIGNTIWHMGEVDTVSWKLFPMNDTNSMVAAVTKMDIQLGTGTGTAVTNTNRSIALGLNYTAVTSVNYQVPLDLDINAKYCLIYTGHDDAGNTYGPNWSTWFTIGSSVVTTYGSPGQQNGVNPNSASLNVATDTFASAGQQAPSRNMMGMGALMAVAAVFFAGF